jgi:hypothetical protein
MTEHTISALWRSQDRDVRAPSSAELAARAAVLHRRVVVRNRIEYAAGALVAAVFVAVAIAVPMLEFRLACLLIILGVAVTCRNLHRQRTTAPDDRIGEACADHYRSELARQRDSLASVWRWYLGPLVPGIVAMFAAVAWRTIPLAGWQATLFAIGPGALAIAGGFVAIHLLNRFAARRLQTAIDALDAERSIG